MAAMFSMEMTGKMYFSLSPFLNKRIVRGTKIISDTSFVTNIDVKKEERERRHRLKFFAEINNRFKNVFLFKALKDAEHHKKSAERMPVNLFYESLCGRRDKQRNDGSDYGHRQHYFFFQKFKYFFHLSISLSKNNL